MTDWTTRKEIGDQHEQRVARELRHRGWTVHPFGQGTYPTAIQNALRLTNSPLRQLPDMIAANGNRIVCIDAKTSLHSTTSNRYAVSRASVQAGLQFTGLNAPVPLYYVFGDLRVLTPSDIAHHSDHGDEHPGGSYFLISTHFARPFESVFGPTPLHRAA
ncbi:hypothetical protein ACGFX4_40230 [Kitasatospora sp. NPDC048365]|uniref:hypothetical protein n=1 Tax=Kitasatospora sp. NPDC048365 TaxID=3364050 RepID=UPI0037209B1F